MPGGFSSGFSSGFSHGVESVEGGGGPGPRTLALLTDAEIALIHTAGDTDPEWDGIYLSGIRLSFLWHCENHTDHEVMSNRYGETNYG